MLLNNFDVMQWRISYVKEFKKNDDNASIKVEVASNSGMCSFAPKLNCPKFTGKN